MIFKHDISTCLLEYITCFKHFYTYPTFHATFVWPLRWKSWNDKRIIYPILIFTQSFIKFHMMVPEIQMKRAKRDILTYIDTFIHTYNTYILLLQFLFPGSGCTRPKRWSTKKILSKVTYFRYLCKYLELG